MGPRRTLHANGAIGATKANDFVGYQRLREGKIQGRAVITPNG
jgi:hypothetical protein